MWGIDVCTSAFRTHICIYLRKTVQHEFNSMLISFILMYYFYIFIHSTTILIFNHFSISKHDLFNCLVSQFLDFFFSSKLVLRSKSAMC